MSRIMLSISIALAFFAVVLFVLAQQLPTPGVPLLVSCAGAGLLAAAGSFAAGGMVVGALARREPATSSVAGSQRVDAS